MKEARRKASKQIGSQPEASKQAGSVKIAEM